MSKTTCLVVGYLKGLSISVKVFMTVQYFLLLNLFVKLIMLFLVELLELLVVRYDVFHVIDHLLSFHFLFLNRLIDLICFIEKLNLVLMLFLFSHLGRRLAFIANFGCFGIDALIW
jgi:hypothetical protein